MALLELTPAAPRFSVRAVLAHVAEVFGRTEDLPSSGDAEQRAFVLDVLRENADAFCCESDVQCMMSVYPGRF